MEKLFTQKEMMNKRILLLGGVLLLSLLFILFFQFRKKTSTEIEFIHLEMFRLIDTLESERGASVIKEDIYLMRGYCDNEMADRQIDSFVCSITEFEKYEYDQLLISFFKESSLSNMKKFQENARDLIRYSVDKDLIYNYSFHEKYRPMYRYTYKGTYISEKYDLNCQRFKKGKKETF